MNFIKSSLFVPPLIGLTVFGVGPTKCAASQPVTPPNSDFTGDVCARLPEDFIRVVMVKNLVLSTAHSDNFAFSIHCQRALSASEWIAGTHATPVRRDGKFMVYGLPASNALGGVEEFYVDDAQIILAPCDKKFPNAPVRGCTVRVPMNSSSVSREQPRLVLSFGISFSNRQSMDKILTLCEQMASPIVRRALNTK
jgi:hypothetical protein